VRPVVLFLAVALAGCGGSHGTLAGPVTVAGHRALLFDADPCEYNGDSGCARHSLGGRDVSVCLGGKRSIAVDAGAGARSVSVSAGERGDTEWIGNHARKGRVELKVRRIAANRFAVVLPPRLPRDLRVLHIDVRYRAGVLTPYTPYNEASDNGGDPRPFKRGIYAVRIRTRPIGDCSS
jgi:hypothetical protein